MVRAVRGERERYRPIVSRLSAGHDPADIAIALANYCAADTLYIADLDAIRGGAVQQAALARIADALPGCALWLDAGFKRVRDAALVCTGRIEPVFGSESLADGDELALLRGRADVLLSLDQRGGQPMDPAGCWLRDDCWPSRVIVMTLDRVGSGGGPSLDGVRQTLDRAPGRRFIAAGGVRNASDLERLEALGVHAVLVATAIHDGTLDRAALARGALPG